MACLRPYTPADFLLTIGNHQFPGCCHGPKGALMLGEETPSLTLDQIPGLEFPPFPAQGTPGREQRALPAVEMAGLTAHYHWGLRQSLV